MSFKFKANVDGDTVYVECVSPVVDRPVTYGISVSPKNVTRLIRAIESGAMISSPEVLVDKDGNSYVGFTTTVRSRELNADLKRLGF